MSVQPLLSATVFDRAAQHRGDLRWLADAWERSRVLCVSPKSATPVVTGAGGVPQLSYRAAADVPPAVPRRFLGVAGGVPYFAATLEPDDGDWRTLRELGLAVDELAAGLFTAAIALEQWHQRQPRCPLWA